MKKIALLTLLISGSAYAHLLPLEDKALLEATDGDVGAAFKMQETCNSAGLSGADCHALMGIGDGDQAAAANKCVASRYVLPFEMKIKNNSEAPGARGHTFGGEPHAGTMWSKEEGNHFYTTSPEIKQAAKESYEAKLIADKVSKKSAVDGISSKSKDVTKSADLGVNSGVTLEGDIGIARGSVSTGVGSTGQTSVTHGESLQKGLLTPQELADIAKKSEAALTNPKLGGYAMDMICSDMFANCMGSSQSVMPSPLWKGAPPKENKDANSSGKSSSSNPSSSSSNKNPPKSEGAKKDVNTSSIEHKDAGMWADNDRDQGGSGTAIARGVEGEDNAFKENIQKCIDNEKRKILKERGSKTPDPNAETLDEKKERAEQELKAGNCDEAYLGRAFCQEFRNKQASNFDVEAKAEKEEARTGAIELFNSSGICNPSLLGKAFCKAEKDKVIKNPVRNDFGDDGTSGLFKPGSTSGRTPSFGSGKLSSIPKTVVRP